MGHPYGVAWLPQGHGWLGCPRPTVAIYGPQATRPGCPEPALAVSCGWGGDKGY